MISSKLVKLYYDKFLPKELDIFGLKFYPSLNDDFGISWRMENPNDLSYNVEVLKGYLEDKVTDFMKLTGYDTGYDMHRKQREKLSQFNHKPLFYLNENDEKEIKKQSDTIKVIDFNNFKFPVKIKKITFQPGYDWIRMEVYFIIENLHIKRKDSKGKIWLQKLDKDESKSLINNHLYLNDDFQQDYMYTLMQPVTNVIWDIPTVVNTDYVFIEIHYGFYYPDGEHAS